MPITFQCRLSFPVSSRACRPSVILSLSKDDYANHVPMPPESPRVILSLSSHCHAEPVEG